MTATLLALVAAAGFSGASLLALLGRELSARGRSHSAAVAAGILLALAFADLFPEGLEHAGEMAVAGFIAGFVLLFLTETFTSAHTYHSPGEGVHKHALGPYIFGLTIHNLADGFVLGVGAKAAAVTSGVVGLGILVHQLPVGISLAAVLMAARASRQQVIRATAIPGLAIPLAVLLTAILPVPGDEALGLLIGAAAGVLTYIGAAHLLPEAQAEYPSRATGLIFALTLILTAAGLMTLAGH